jgi:hypothetical protein
MGCVQTLIYTNSTWNFTSEDSKTSGCKNDFLRYYYKKKGSSENKLWVNRRGYKSECEYKCKCKKTSQKRNGNERRKNVGGFVMEDQLTLTALEKVACNVLEVNIAV